ncbi:hypothetical protein SUNI508_04853 [Seiridium unicorne]|uniref:Uncharacterized protein n=1 Tax=Seiridium unicorne TaxID=138068 RepID=A0ABR2V6I0_9PEZI
MFSIRNTVLASAAAVTVRAATSDCFTLQGSTASGQQLDFVHASDAGSDSYLTEFADDDTLATVFGINADTGVMLDYTDTRIANLDSSSNFGFLFFDSQQSMEQFDQLAVNCTVDANDVLGCVARDNALVNVFNYCNGLVAIAETIRPDFQCQGLALTASQTSGCASLSTSTSSSATSTLTTSTSSTENSTLSTTSSTTPLITSSAFSFTTSLHVAHYFLVAYHLIHQFVHHNAHYFINHAAHHYVHHVTQYFAYYVTHYFAYHLRSFSYRAEHHIILDYSRNDKLDEPVDNLNNHLLNHLLCNAKIHTDLDYYFRNHKLNRPIHNLADHLSDQLNNKHTHYGSQQLNKPIHNPADHLSDQLNNKHIHYGSQQLNEHLLQHCINYTKRYLHLDFDLA